MGYNFHVQNIFTMRKIDNTELTKILILLILVCSGIILSWILQSVLILLMAFAGLGIFVVAIFKARSSSWNGKDELIASVGIAILSLLASYFLPINYFVKKLTHTYFRANIEYFDKISDTDNFDPHRYVFAFDNSGGKDRIGKKISDEMLPIYKQYCDEIKKYYGNVNFDKNDYRAFIKARLCFDLSHINDNGNDKFIVFKIGDPDNKYLAEEQNDYIPCTKESLENSIEQICASRDVNNVDRITNFENLYKRINDITKDEKYSYTIFFYSDFINDLNNHDRIEEHYAAIKDLQKMLIERNISQNVIYSPPYDADRKNLRSVEKDVLPNGNGHILKLYKIDSLDISTTICYKIKETVDIPIFYQSDNMCDKVKIVFMQKEKTLIRCIENYEGFVIYDGNDRYYYSDNNPIQSDTITIKYNKNTLPNNDLKMEIIRNGVHYIMKLSLERNEIGAIVAIGILLTCPFFGWLLVLGISNLRNKKSKTNI